MGKLLFYAIIAWIGITIYKFVKNIKVINDKKDRSSLKTQNKNDVLDAEFTDIKEEE